MTDTAINWTPLERFCAITVLDADNFMYMGDSRVDMDDQGTAQGTLIHLYKHCDTRRYLNLDNAGHAYRYDGRTGNYQPHTNALDAVTWVLS